MFEWVIALVSVWFFSGFVPALLYMLARARDTYYIDPWLALKGGIRGPFFLWELIQKRQNKQK